MATQLPFSNSCICRQIGEEPHRQFHHLRLEILKILEAGYHSRQVRCILSDPGAAIQETSRLLEKPIRATSCAIRFFQQPANRTATAALPPIPPEVQQKNKIQRGGRDNSEINGTSRWEDVGFVPVELLVVAEDQIFCSHSIVAGGKDRQLQAA